jgi:hypothetical protein
MQLVSYQNSPGININHQKHILTVATVIDQLKNWSTLNYFEHRHLVSCAHVRGSQSGLGWWGPRVDSRWEGGWAVGSLMCDGAPVCGGWNKRWRWTMMAGADGGGRVHASVGQMLSSHAGCGAPSSDPARWGVIVFLYLKKNYYSDGPCWGQQPHCCCGPTVTVESRPSLLCNHCSKTIVATCHLPIATVGYNPFLQSLFVVVNSA